MQTAKEKRDRATQHTRSYRSRHPDRVKLSRSNVYQKRKLRMLNILGGAFCAKCGCDEIGFLEINHIEGGGSKEIRANKASLTDKILSGERSTVGLNVLCRVCNAIDFLIRKNPKATGKFITEWRKAELINGTPAN